MAASGGCPRILAMSAPERTVRFNISSRKARPKAAPAASPSPLNRMTGRFGIMGSVGVMGCSSTSNRSACLSSSSRSPNFASSSLALSSSSRVRMFSRRRSRLARWTWTSGTLTINPFSPSTISASWFCLLSRLARRAFRDSIFSLRSWVATFSAKLAGEGPVDSEDTGIGEPCSSREAIWRRSAWMSGWASV